MAQKKLAWIVRDAVERYLAFESRILHRVDQSGRFFKRAAFRNHAAHYG